MSLPDRRTARLSAASTASGGSPCQALSRIVCRARPVERGRRGTRSADVARARRRTVRPPRGRTCRRSRRPPRCASPCGQYRTAVSSPGTSGRDGGQQAALQCAGDLALAFVEAQVLDARRDPAGNRFGQRHIVGGVAAATNRTDELECADDPPALLHRHRDRRTQVELRRRAARASSARSMRCDQVVGDLGMELGDAACG